MSQAILCRVLELQKNNICIIVKQMLKPLIFFSQMFSFLLSPKILTKFQNLPFQSVTEVLVFTSVLKKKAEKIYLVILSLEAAACSLCYETCKNTEHLYAKISIMSCVYLLICAPLQHDSPFPANTNTFFRVTTIPTSAKPFVFTVSFTQIKKEQKHTGNYEIILKSSGQSSLLLWIINHFNL